MRDRTMILFALLFLAVAVGTGVNKSLEACNRMIGKPMAPGIGEIYDQRAPQVISRVDVLTRYGRQRGEEIVHSYPAAVSVMEKATLRAGTEIKAGVMYWQQRVEKTLKKIRNYINAKKIKI